MITVEHSIEIRRPVEAVFAFVSDPRQLPQWQAAIQEVRVTPDGPPTVGTRVTQVVSFLGVKLEPTAEITTLEPNRSFSFKGTSGPLSAEGTSRFEATGEGTRLSSTFQIEPGGLFKVAGPVFARQLKKQSEADLRRRKRPVGGAEISRRAGCHVRLPFGIRASTVAVTTWSIGTTSGTFSGHRSHDNGTPARVE